MTYANESETEPLALAIRERDHWQDRAEKAEARADRVTVDGVTYCAGEVRLVVEQVAELEKRIESGRSAHNEDRVARDWLARRKLELEARVAELEEGIRNALHELTLGYKYGVIHATLEKALGEARRPPSVSAGLTSEDWKDIANGRDGDDRNEDHNRVEIERAAWGPSDAPAEGKVGSTNADREAMRRWAATGGRRDRDVVHVGHVGHGGVAFGEPSSVAGGRGTGGRDDDEGTVASSSLRADQEVPVLGDGDPERAARGDRDAANVGASRLDKARIVGRDKQVDALYDLLEKHSRDADGKWLAGDRIRCDIVTGILGIFPDVRPDYPTTIQNKQENRMNFGQAVEEAKAGKKIARAGWNGKNMWVAFMPPVVIPEGMVNGRTKQFVPSGDLNVGGYFVMWTATGVWQPGWLAAQPDMLADDWSVLS